MVLKLETSQLFEVSYYQDCEEMFRVEKFSNELPATSKMEEMKPVVTEKHQFERRRDSKLMALFRNFRTIRIPTQGLRPTVSHGKGMPLVQSFQLMP